MDNITRLKELIDNKKLSICPSSRGAFNLHQMVIVRFDDDVGNIYFHDENNKKIATMFYEYFDDRQLKIIYQGNGDLYQIEVGEYIFLAISEITNIKN